MWKWLSEIWKELKFRFTPMSPRTTGDKISNDWLNDKENSNGKRQN